eukprot:790003-Amphidinium_carterae.1
MTSEVNIDLDSVSLEAENVCLATLWKPHGNTFYTFLCSEWTVPRDNQHFGLCVLCWGWGCSWEQTALTLQGASNLLWSYAKLAVCNGSVDELAACLPASAMLSAEVCIPNQSNYAYGWEIPSPSE